MSAYVLPVHKHKHCALCGAENSTCKAEGDMGPSQGVVFIGMDPKYSVGPEIVGPSLDEGTVSHRFAKKNTDPAESIKVAPTVKTRRGRKVKEETKDVDGKLGSAEQGRRRGGRGRQRRQVDGPGSVG